MYGCWRQLIYRPRSHIHRVLFRLFAHSILPNNVINLTRQLRGDRLLIFFLNDWNADLIVDLFWRRFTWNGVCVFAKALGARALGLKISFRVAFIIVWKLVGWRDLLLAAVIREETLKGISFVWTLITARNHQLHLFVTSLSMQCRT